MSEIKSPLINTLVHLLLLEKSDKNLFFEIRNRSEKAKQIKQEYIKEELIEYSNRNNSFFKVDNSIVNFLFQISLI